MDFKQMLEIGKRCTEEEYAPCMDACPLHIDIRMMLKHIQGGKWDSAWQVYQKQAVLPLLLTHLCDGPCRNACLHSKSDGGLELPLLERAVFNHAERLEPPKYAVPRKKASVSIVGAGLTGLTAAMMLAQSGYRIELYEKESRIGGNLWVLADSVLPRPLLQAQLAQVTQEHNIILHHSTEIHSPSDCIGDAVILATGSREKAYRIISRDETSDGSDFWAWQTENGIFIAGADFCDEPVSFAEAIAAGKRAAQYADWYVRGMKPEPISYQRGRSKLKPDTSAMKTENAVYPADGRRYTPEEAKKEAARCIQCRCLRCVKICELLRQNRSYPKKYINDIYQTLNLVDKFSENVCKRQIYSCNLCGQCKTSCPESVDMSRIYLNARRILYEKGSLPPAFHEFFLNDMRFSNGEAALLLPGEKGTRYLFFPGCRLGAFLPLAVEGAFEFLNNRLQGQVALLLGCCGAPAYWAGREDLHSDALAALREKWKALGRPEVILACPSCAKLLRQYAPEIPEKSLWELFESIGLPEGTLDLYGQEIAVFDACSASENAELQHSVRALLESRGAVLTPMKETGGCCGYGGLISHANPELLERIVQRRITQNEAEYVTYCINCRDTFLRRGKRTRHLLEILFPDKEDEALPSLGRQRDNRRLLTSRLTGVPFSPERQMIILADSAVLEKLDRQLILPEQVQQVVTYCEQTGRFVYDENNGTYFGSYREGAVTFWVEYKRLRHQYQIINAYSHHMALIDDTTG